MNSHYERNRLRWFCLLFHIELFYRLRFPIARRWLLSFWIKPIPIWVQNITICSITPSPIENMTKKNLDAKKSWITHYFFTIINIKRKETFQIFFQASYVFIGTQIENNFWNVGSPFWENPQFGFLWIPSKPGSQHWKVPYFLIFINVKKQCVQEITIVISFVILLTQKSIFDWQKVVSCLILVILSYS